MIDDILNNPASRLTDRLDIEDRLNEVLAELMFLQHAASQIFGDQDSQPGEKIKFGMYLMIDDVMARIARIGLALRVVDCPAQRPSACPSPLQ